MTLGSDWSLSDYETSDDTEIEPFRIKNLLIKLSQLLTTIRLALPILLFGYSITSLVFLIMFAVPMTRNFLESLIPENITIILFKVLSLFSIDEMMDMNVGLGMGKSFIVMVISIVWWVLQRQ